GRNVTIEYRWAQFQNDRLPELAADLVRRRVAVIATPGSPIAALAAKATTATIPIVFSSSGDPGQKGLVAGLKRPGGNLTGLSDMNAELVTKQIGLLHELKPGTARLAALANPGRVATIESLKADLESAASAIGRQIEILYAQTSREIDSAFASFVQM